MNNRNTTTLLQNYYKNYYTFLLYFTVFSYNVVIVVIKIYTSIKERDHDLSIGGYVGKKLLHFRFFDCGSLKHWVFYVVVPLFKKCPFFSYGARNIKGFYAVAVGKLLHQKTTTFFTLDNHGGEKYSFK